MDMRVKQWLAGCLSAAVVLGCLPFAGAADDTAQALDSGGVCPAALDECMDVAAARLADEMLTAKFVQGLPVVGIAGGLQNVPVYRRVTSYAARAYEKRALLRRG